MKNNTTTHNTFKFFAFISYSSHDATWGLRLQRKLENFSLPTAICRDKGIKDRKPMRPIFFAPTDIQPGDLTEEIKTRLTVSHFLIVICSPHAAQSEWVGKEIAFFHNLGRTNDIYFFIIDGEPHSIDPTTECFHPIIDKLGIPEKLGVNIHEKVSKWAWINRERAYIRLITKLLDIEFDSLWKRHQRLIIEKTITCFLCTCATIATCIFIYIANQPTDIAISLAENSYHNDSLPQLHKAIITMSLRNETKIDTINTLKDTLLFHNIPHRFLGDNTRFTITCPYYYETDTIIALQESVTLPVTRDTTFFGEIQFRLLDTRLKPISHCTISIADTTATSSEEGRIAIYIPLHKQRRTYHITADFPLTDSTLYMPCGKDDIKIAQ